MIKRLGRCKARWQSEDGLVSAGLGNFVATRFFYVSLGNRLLNASDLQGLVGFLENIAPEYPLLLLSCCPGFQTGKGAEAQGLSLLAGRYRALQQAYKRDQLIYSYIYDVGINGVLFTHGMSAQARLADPETQFYQNTDDAESVALETVLKNGLLTGLLPKEAFPEWFLTQISLNALEKEFAESV